MKKKTTIFRFPSKNFLGRAMLELRLWHVSEDKYTIISDDKINSLATRNNNVIDVILETFRPDEYIVEVKETR